MTAHFMVDESAPSNTRGETGPLMFICHVSSVDYSSISPSHTFALLQTYRQGLRFLLGVE